MLGLRSGVSPIIAASLIIVITVSIGLLLYAWYSGYVGRVMVKPVGSGVVVIDYAQLVYSRSSNTLTVNLYVRNVGSDAVSIVRVYATYATGSPTYAFTIKPRVVLGPGDSLKISATQTLQKPPPYGKYVITVISLGGNTFKTITTITYR